MNVGRHLPGLLAVLLLLLWPLLRLSDCVSGSATFVPYDLAQFPPAGVTLTPEQFAATSAGSNFDVTEVPVWFVPELQLARAAVADGTLPQWNPAARTGTVLLGHGHLGLWYPPTWSLLLRVDPKDGLALLAWLGYAIAGVLAYGLLRALGLSRLAALFGAVTFAASGTAMASGHNYPRLHSLLWLPGMLWAALRAAAHTGWGKVPALCAFAACFAMTWVAGFPPYSAACSLLALGFGLWLGLAHALRGGPRAALQVLLPLAAAGAAGVLLCAVHLLPVLQFFLSDSARPMDPDLARVSHVVFDWYGFLGYLVPDLFGRPDLGPLLPYDRSPLPLLLGLRSEHGGAALPPNFNATEYAVFAGSLGVVLAGLGALAGRGGHRAFALIALAVLWAMATFTWPFGHLFALPGIRTIPPLRLLGPASLLVAWLAALGLEALRHAAGRRLPALAAGAALLLCGLGTLGAHRLSDPAVFERWGLPQRVASRYAHLGAPGAITPEFVRDVHLRSPDRSVDYAEQGRLQAGSATARTAYWYFAAGLLLACFALRFRHRGFRAGAAAAVTLAALAQLSSAGATFVRGRELVHDTWTPVHGFLLAQRDALAAQGGFMVARAARVPGLPAALPPGTLQPHRIRDLQVYTYFDRHSAMPLTALFGPAAAGKGYVEQSLPDDERLQHPLLDLLGVRYLLSAEPLQHAGARVGPELRGPMGEFFVYQRPRALPRAFVVPELQLVPDETAAVTALADASFAPGQRAVVTASEAARAGLGELQHEPEAGSRQVRFGIDRGSEVELEVGPGAAGFLVLADTLLPGWRVQIDGEPAQLLRVNHSMRGVAVPDRACRVRFAYRAPWLLPGLGLTVLALAGMALLLWRARRLTGA